MGLLPLVMANSAFYHSLSEFVLLTEYFESPEKSKVALMTFEVSKTKKIQEIKALFDKIVVIYQLMYKQIFQ